MIKMAKQATPGQVVANYHGEWPSKRDPYTSPAWRNASPAVICTAYHHDLRNANEAEFGGPRRHIMAPGPSRFDRYGRARRRQAMAAKEPKTCKLDGNVSAAVSMSALVRHNLTAAMANLFEAKVIHNEIFPAVRDQIARAPQGHKEAIGDDPALDTVVLLVSELTTNSVLHSGSSFFGLLVTRVADGELRVAVTDEGRRGLPHLHQQAPANECGRGVHLMDTLAQRWGITRQAGVGVAVWFDAR
jgi:hypothetical protein